MTADSTAAGSPGGPGRPTLQLLAAVDVSRRQVLPARRAGGLAAASNDPVEVAWRWQLAGADWLHLVDIDAAFGSGSNRDVLRGVVERLDIDVEVSGGIHDDVSLETALATGCRRVILGTEALATPAWCAEAISAYGDRIAVALDVRGTTLAPRGGHPEGGELASTLSWLDAQGCVRYVVTDVARDGSLRGPNVELLRAVCAGVSGPVIASGGVSTLADLAALAALVPAGVEGAIIGTALYTGTLDLGAALRFLHGGTG